MTDPDPRALEMNFSWLQPGTLAACRGPRSSRDFAFLRERGVRALVLLADKAELGISDSDLTSSGIDILPEPVDDWTPPTQPQIDRALAYIDSASADSKPVAVSCGAGCGRTGTVLACYMVSRGLTPSEAVQALVQLRPCSKELLNVPGQMEAIQEYHRRTQQP